jgi:hypothetical protein
MDKDVLIKKDEVIVNNNKPFFLHCPGAGFLDNIIIKLGYDYDYNHKIKDEVFYDLFITKVWQSIFANYIYYFLFFLFFIFIFYFLFKYNKIKLKQRIQYISKWIYSRK